MAHCPLYEKTGHIANYINGLEIKMTKDKGRGVFATRDLKEGELIIVETPIAYFE